MQNSLYIYLGFLCLYFHVSLVQVINLVTCHVLFHLLQISNIEYLFVVLMNLSSDEVGNVHNFFTFALEPVCKMFSAFFPSHLHFPV